MMQVITFDAHFLHGVRGKQRANLRNNRSIHARNDNCIADLQGTVDQHDIDSCSMAFNNLDLDNRALEFIFLLKLLSDFLLGLAHVAELEHKIRKTFAGDGRCRNEAKRVFRRSILPIEGHVKALFVEGEDGLLDLGFEVSFGVVILAVEGVTGVVARLGLPHV